MSKNKYPYKQYGLANLPGEQWESIPYLDGAYEISSFGRVKSLRRWVERENGRGFWTKDRIIKSVVNKQKLKFTGQTYCRIMTGASLDGRKYSIANARLVYFLFVKKFNLEDRSLVVSYKDEDAFNICPENLVLTNPGVNMRKAIEKGRRSIECFDNKPLPISQYDLDGKYINTFRSISAAASANGISSSQISEALNHRNSYSGGYVWRYGKSKANLSEIPKYVIDKKKSVKLHSTVVTQYDLKGNRIKEYPNLKVAAKAVKVQLNQIRFVALGKSFTAKGYYWTLGAGPQKINIEPVIAQKNRVYKKLSRPVTQYDWHGKRVGFYDSLTAAAKKLNVSLITMGKKNETVQGYGYLWRYGRGPASIKVPEKIKQREYLRQLSNQTVTQYDLNGKRVATFDTAIEAAKKINSQLHTLIGALTGKYLSCQGYYWRPGEGDAQIQSGALEKAEQRRLKKLSKTVTQYDLSGRRIKTYASLGEAGRATNTTPSQIAHVANGIYKAAKGFIWKFE